MNRNQLESTFDQQAETYDQQWAKLAPFRDGIHLLMASIFAGLPENARMLCVGAGTGAEILFLAKRFPAWSFVAVEPAAGMVKVAQLRAEESGVADRCTFHTGYLESLPAGEPFDCASSLLVSQFLLDPRERQISSDRSPLDSSRAASWRRPTWLPIRGRRISPACWRSGCAP